MSIGRSHTFKHILVPVNWPTAISGVGSSTRVRCTVLRSGEVDCKEVQSQYVHFPRLGIRGHEFSDPKV